MVIHIVLMGTVAVFEILKFGCIMLVSLLIIFIHLHIYIYIHSLYDWYKNSLLQETCWSVS